MLLYFWHFVIDMYLFSVRFAVTFNRHALLRTCLFVDHSQSHYQHILTCLSRMMRKVCNCQTLCSSYMGYLYDCLDLYCHCFDGVIFVHSLPGPRGHLLAICIRCLLILEWITKAGIFSSEKKMLKEASIVPYSLQSLCTVALKWVVSITYEVDIRICKLYFGIRKNPQ